MPPTKRKSIAESRTRYFTREVAGRRGWNTAHLNKGGDVLEEQEISQQFPDIGLGLERPDFLFCLRGEPCMVVEAKADAKQIDNAIQEAMDYADAILKTNKYKTRIAVGIAGTEETGHSIEVRFRTNQGWKHLQSNNYNLTTLPSWQEVDSANEADDATTTVQVPSQSEFIDAAIELSQVLRTAKVEAPKRPRVIGAIVLAMYDGLVDVSKGHCLKSIQDHVRKAVNGANDLDDSRKEALISNLQITGPDFSQLEDHIGRIVSLLRRLNIAAVIHTDIDFLGMFYEAFLRYGYDNASLGIVFTPRHITNFCADLVGVSHRDRVIDVACGTGGFLVSAFDRMLKSAAGNPMTIAKVKQSLAGTDTNPTVWALSMLNMFFRGDGKSGIKQHSCLTASARREVAGKFTRSFLNPPFSQKDEPERDFIDAALAALEPDGLLAVVVKAGIFADEDHTEWRKRLLKHHTVLSVISLPDDLFYPTAAPTSILVAKAHIPHDSNTSVFMARIDNDGYKKLKNRRVECAGSQLKEIDQEFQKFLSTGAAPTSARATLVNSKELMNGQELCPQQWLPQPPRTDAEITAEIHGVHRSLYQAIAAMPAIADVVIEEFATVWSDLPVLPYGIKREISYFFRIENGKSSGESNYPDGDYPYISSGDASNSVVRMVEVSEDHLFSDGGITVTAFGQACLQAWPFAARGNGGSAVRVLIPKFKMNVSELAWFAAQINAQRWRFFYARMAIKSRLLRLVVESPAKMLVSSHDLSSSVKSLRDNFEALVRAE